MIGFAILIMFGWHLWSIGHGETSVEVQDNDQYRKIARSRGQVCGSILLVKTAYSVNHQGICQFIRLGVTCLFLGAGIRDSRFRIE